MAGPGNILITVGAQTAEAVRNLGNVNKALGDTQTTGQKMSAGLRKAALPAAAVLAGLGAAAFGASKAAMEDAASADHLAQTMKRVTGAHAPAIKQMEDYISTTELATGVSDDKLRPAMEKLITATGDQAKAQKLMNQVMDISAATGKDVDTVSTAVAKGYQGQTSSLSRLVPGISEASRKSKDFTVIMDELADKTGGAAAKAADTASGKMARFQVSISELQESIGYALLPVIEALVPILLKVAAFAQDNTGAIEALAAVVAVLAGGVLAANAALKVYEAAQVAVKVATAAWTAAQWLLNAALDANPIGVVVVALAALGAALVVAYNKSETFRDIVKSAMAAVEKAVDALGDAFTAVLKAAEAAWNWIVDHWKVALFALGPIGAAIALLVDHWDNVKAAASQASAGMEAALAAIQRAAGAFRDAIAASLGAVKGAIDAAGDAFDRVKASAQAAWDWITGHWRLALFALGPIGAAIYELVSKWDAVSQAAQDAAAGVQAAVTTIANAVAGMAGAIRRAVSSSLGWLQSLIGKLDSVIGAVRDVLGWLDKIHVPNLPGLPHIPTPWAAAPGASTRAVGSSASGSSRSTPAAAIVVNVYGALDPEGVARQIKRLLADHDRRQGLALA